MAIGLDNLKVYQLALDGVKRIYELTNKDRIKRDYSLVDQIRRASISVAANIAEGYGRNSKRDFAQFLSIAIGSSNEVITYLDIVEKIYFIKSREVRNLYESLGKQTYSFRKKLLT